MSLVPEDDRERTPDSVDEYLPLSHRERNFLSMVHQANDNNTRLTAEVEQLKRLLKQRGEDAARAEDALNEIIAEGYDSDFAVETARNALGLKEPDA